MSVDGGGVVAGGDVRVDGGVDVVDGVVGCLGGGGGGGGFGWWVMVSREVANAEDGVSLGSF
jgi:hypothetical protein